MKSINPKLIKVVSNPRKDFGNLEELKNSIEECGILEPLIINSNKELIAGERRLRCALELGLKVIPVIEISSDDKNFHEEIKLVENIQRKDLTPMEEARAFKGYIKKAKIDEKLLSTKISKTVEYVVRRINLLKLDSSCWDAVNKRKIELGHAQLLCQMNKNQQKEAMNEIIEWDLTVQNFSDQIRWMKKVDFGELKFRPEEEYGPEKNQKTLMDSLGQELNPKSDYANLDMMGSPAFKKEMATYVESERQKLRNKKINVFSSQEELMKEHPKAVLVGSWEGRYARIVKNLPGNKGTAVVVDISYELSKDVFELDPKQEKEKGSSEKSTPDDQEEARKTLNLSRKEKLKSKVAEFKRGFLIEKCKEMLRPGPLTDKVVIYYLMESFEPDHRMGMESKMKKLFAKGEVLNEVKRLAENIFYNMDEEVLKIASDKIGVNLNKHFNMTEGFLELHTKEQLIKLAKELKIDLGKSTKNTEMIEIIKKEWKKGQVPKILER